MEATLIKSSIEEPLPFVPGNIPEFPNLEGYMIESANYPDLLPEPPKEIEPMKRYPPRRMETEIFKQTITEPPPKPGMMQLADDIQVIVDNLKVEQPKPNPSLLSKLIADFTGWRRSRPRKKYVEIRTDGDLSKLLHGIRNENADHLPFTPSFILDKSTNLSRLVSLFVPTETLVRAGLHDLSIEQLAENGLTISSLRCYQRSPADLAKFYSTFEFLLAAGFNRLHFDSRLWTLEKIADAFNISPNLMANMCMLDVRDLLYAGVLPGDLSKYGVTSEVIRDDRAGQPFEIYYALNMTPFDLKNTFGFKAEHLFKQGRPTMNNTQLCVLWHRCKWTADNLRKVGGTTEILRRLNLPTGKV